MSDDDMTTADVLDAAADYIRVHGGIRYQRNRDGEPRCASGAILSALGNEESMPCASVEPHWHEALQAAHDYVTRTFDNFSSIVEFNDAASPDEVIDALMSCAADLRLRGTP